MKSLLYALTASSLMFQAIAQEGVQFEAVPISINSACKPVIFKGTKRSRGTAFLMPRLRLAKTSKGTDGIEFLKFRSGKMQFQLGLYFPKFSIRNEKINYENYQESSCNYQQLKQAINNSISDENDKIKRIVTLQVKNIGVEVSTVNGEFKAASEKTNILNYLGQVKKFEIPLASQDEWNDVQDVLESDLGLNMNVNFEFLARESNGYCRVKIDMNKVADQVRSTINSQHDIKNAKLPIGQLSAAVGDALKNMDLNIDGSVYCEDSTNTQFTSSFYKQLATVLTNIGQSLAGYRPPSYLGYGSGGYDDDWSGDDQLLPGDEDLLSSGNNGGSNLGSDLSGIGSSSMIDDPATGYGSTTSAGADPSRLPQNLPPAKFNGPGIAVQGFLQRLRDHKVYKFDAENNGKNEVRTFTTSILIRKDIDGRPRLTLTSGADSVSTKMKMKAGDQLKLYPLRQVSHPFNYKKDVTYYSKETLESVRNIFPKLDKLDPNLVTNKNDIADLQLVDEESLKIYMPTMGTVSVKMIGEYIYGEENYIPESLNEIKKPFNGVLMSSKQGSDLASALESEFNVGFIFNKSKPGKVYSISQLMKLSEASADPFISVTYDSEDDVIILEAKKDLGVLRVKNLNKMKVKSFAPKRYFEDSRKKAYKYAGILPVGYMKKYKGPYLRTYYGDKTVQQMPTEINDIVFKLEKVGEYGNEDTDGSHDFPVILHHESSDGANGTDDIIETVED